MQFAQSFDNELLQNPYPQDVTNNQEEDAPQPVRPDPNQLSFDLQPRKFSVRQWIERVRYRATRREAELELIPFWRNFSSSFAVISSACVALILLVSGMALFNRLPPRIPFYYNSVEARWEQADKVLILFLPIVLGIIDAVLLRFIYDIFAYDKRLSIMLSWMLTMVNLLIIVATGQIYSLIL